MIEPYGSRRRRAALAVFILLGWLASSREGIALKPGETRIGLERSNDRTALTIQDNLLGSPLRIGSPEGLFYFETEQGRHWVGGEPAESHLLANGYFGRWDVAGRRVTVEFQPQPGRIDDWGGRQLNFALHAAPDDGISGWGLTLDAQEREYFTGLFERVVDGKQEESWAKGIQAVMNLRGQKVEMLIHPTLSLYCPFYLSSRGYGLFFEGSWPGRYDLAASDPDLVQISFEGPSLSGIFYLAKTPAPIVQAHSLHVGPTVLPPRWVFEPLRWRDEHQHRATYYDGTPVNAPYNSQLVEDVLMMQALDVPYRTMWVDRPWSPGLRGFDDYAWDLERFPNAGAMIQWLKSNDKQFLLWIAPWVMGEMALTAVDRGYCLPTNDLVAALGFTDASLARHFEEQGPQVLQPLLEHLARVEPSGSFSAMSKALFGEEIADHETARQRVVAEIEKIRTREELVLFLRNAHRNQSVLIDFTNPEAVAWWQQQGLRKLLKQGVAAFKLDRAEQLVPEVRGVIAADGRTARELRNDYPREYAAASYNIARQYFGNDILIMPRAGYSYSSRYAAFWGGDIFGPPEGLRAALIAVQRCAIIGFPIWGSDTGGYHREEREPTARWLGFSCFTPIFEVGPLDNRAPWDTPWEPHYDTELIAIWRLYSTLRYRLLDYHYMLAVDARRQGMPPVRPLFLEYPEQPAAWNDWATYKYGPDLLVSVIWESGRREQTLYLPGGAEWIDAWNPEQIHAGGKTITVEAPLHKIPLFIRKGSILQLGDLNALYEDSLKYAANKPDLAKLEAAEFNAARSEPIHIEGPELENIDFDRSDGGLEQVPGAQTFVVVSADPAHPEAGDGRGWTYQHHPDIAVWKDRLYVGWDSCERDEDTWPSRELYSTSPDGEHWSFPEELFPQGVSTPLRMYFFLAPNGRMLAIAGLRVNHEKTAERNKGPLVVREIRADHTLGAVYTLRKPGQPPEGALPFFDGAADQGLVEACRQLLADRMYLQQQDYGVLLDPAERIKWHDPANWDPNDKLYRQASEFGKAMCFFQRADGALVAVMKRRWVTVSHDGGKSWDKPVRPNTLITHMGKVWGQQTPDGRYILVYNPHPRNRWPLAIVYSDDGITFSGMRAIHGELPEKRFEGENKSPGASYIRGLSRWNNDGSLGNDAVWLTYSVNKEEIRVCRLPYY